MFNWIELNYSIIFVISKIEYETDKSVQQINYVCNKNGRKPTKSWRKVKAKKYLWKNNHSKIDNRYN